MLDMPSIHWSGIASEPLALPSISVLLTVFPCGIAAAILRRRLERGFGSDVERWRITSVVALRGRDALLEGGVQRHHFPHREVGVAVREDVVRRDSGPTGRSRRHAITSSTPPGAGVEAAIEEAWEDVEEGSRAVDRGSQVATERGVAFGGMESGEKIPWPDVIDVVDLPGRTTYEIHLRDGANRVFGARDPDPGFGAFLRLAHARFARGRIALSAT